MLRWNKKNEAFTLVEVLAVIVILGILSTIGIVTITNIRKNQEKKFDQTQYELFRETAKTYFSDHKSKIPVIPGGASEVYLEDLINENYLDSLLDYHKKSYSLDSYVTAIKLGENLYTYIVNLHKEGSNEEIKDMTDTGGDIVLSNYRKKSDKELMSGSSDNEDVEIYYSNETVKIDLDISDNDGILAYNYFIYKNNIRIYNSEYITINDNSTKDTLVLDTNNHGDGTYQIEVVVYDAKNHVKSKKSEKIMIDRVAPSCTVTGGGSNWISASTTTQSRTVTAQCSDEHSGCVTSKFSKEYKNDINIQNAGAKGEGIGGTVYDKAGNSTDCPANRTVKIDKTAPKCKTTGESIIWTNDDRKLTFTCSDATSGCKTSQKTKTITQTNKTLEITSVTVQDNAGNTTTCKSAKNTSVFNIYVDKVKPTISSFVVNTRDTNSRYNTRIANPTATITENLSDEVKYSIKVDNITKTTATIENDPDIFNMISKVITMSTEHDGSSHTVKLCAEDLAGNQTCKEKTYTVYKKCTNIIESLNAPCGLVTISYPDEYLGGSCKPSIQETRTTAAPNTCYVGNTEYDTNSHRSACDGTSPFKSYQISNSESEECKTNTSGHWIYCTDSSGRLLTMLKGNWGGNQGPHSQWACNFNFNPPVKVGSVIEIPQGTGTKFTVIDDSNGFWKSCTNKCYY